MRSIWKTVAIGTLAVLSGKAADAADVRQLSGAAIAPPPVESSPLLVDEFGSNWYLRGDIGYRKNEVDSVFNAANPHLVRNNDLDNSWALGLGVGYKMGWLRSDLTLDYGAKSEFSGNNGGRKFTARIDNIAGLVNVYGDLGTWFGITPYVGAGIGFANLHTTNFTGRGGANTGQDSSTNVAWAYMAGLNYQVGENYSIDLGYRHINMGDAVTGTDGNDNQFRLKKMSADEIRLGFRYMLD